ncbi:hypothetical protein AB1N83_011802 [Pleurotus pulmonarius]
MPETEDSTSKTTSGSTRRKLEEADFCEPCSDDVERLVPREYITQLTPPIGTSFFKYQTATLFDNEPFEHVFMDVVTILIQTLTWKVDVYAYVTGAKPDEDFEENGGAVVVVLVHSGWLSYNGRLGESVSRVTAPALLAAQAQLPPSGSGLENGEYWNYTISYQAAMNMFNNMGNDTFTFDAKYKEDFSRKNPQTGVTTLNGVEFGSDLETSGDIPQNYNLAGVSVFRAGTLGAFPAKFSFEASCGYSNEQRLASKTVDVWVDINCAT